MKIFVIVSLFIPATLRVFKDSGDLIRGSIRSWGEPAFGLRASIAVEKTRLSKGSPFIISVIVENISDNKVDLPVISAFHLRNPEKKTPESTLTFGSYWCPVNLAGRNSAEKAGLILGSPSRLVIEKGQSLVANIDLARHGWDKSISSYWPARHFDSVVASGSYTLRLDIQVSGIDPKWIRSNEIRVAIGK